MKLQSQCIVRALKKIDLSCFCFFPFFLDQKDSEVIVTNGSQKRFRACFYYLSDKNQIAFVAFIT